MAHIPGYKSKHLKPGSECPPLAPDTLRFYNMRFCPFAHRTLLVLSAKNLKFEIVNVNLKHKPDWFLARNPLGKLPVLEINDTVIYESPVCNEWLDQIYPQNPILPKDPTKAAKQKMRSERLSKLVGIFYGIARNQDAEKLQTLTETLYLYEQLLGTSNYYGGTEPAWSDYMSWPWLERLEAVPLVSNGVVPCITEDNYPKLTNYIKRMKEQPAVKAVSISAELHAMFIQSFLSGEPNFDLGTEESDLKII